MKIRLQELASENRKLVQEIAPTRPACETTERAFKGIGLEASLDFASSADALSVVKHFKQGIEQKRDGEVIAREAVISALNESRCLEAPIIGQDAVQAVKITRSVLYLHSTYRSQNCLFWKCSKRCML